MKHFCAPILLALAALSLTASAADLPPGVKLSPVTDAQGGFAGSSINTVIFRHSPLVSSNNTQYTAFYDNDAHLILAKRKLSADKWDLKRTDFTGNVRDAHNTISLGIDGSGILHLAWDHHGNALNYLHTIAPGSLDLTQKLPMDGQRENQVTYPEFYSLPNGDLLFLYRVGASGNGDLVLKRYHTSTQKWETIAQNLVAGESRQNAYPEFCVDPKGNLHLAWVWRRTPDVATNHNLCYARSTDGGATWTTSAGKTLSLPITAATAEIALAIPERSDLINQTSIAADAQGHPYIATYFRPLDQPAGPAATPQYQIVYHDGTAWHTSQVGARTTPFSLAGAGTKRIPISRPLILVDSSATPPAPPRLFMVFRDAERQDRVTLASNADISKSNPTGAWSFKDLTTDGYSAWEPSFDPSRWSQDHTLNLFLQKTDQLDGNDNAARALPPTPVSILEYKP